uniref:Uncharacterized protein n=1 Tax=Marmota marmota marmota TaxID=9994 RepID=A0A8C5ZM85_MARMA
IDYIASKIQYSSGILRCSGGLWYTLQFSSFLNFLFLMLVSFISPQG